MDLTHMEKNFNDSDWDYSDTKNSCRMKIALEKERTKIRKIS